MQVDIRGLSLRQRQVHARSKDTEGAAVRVLGGAAGSGLVLKGMGDAVWVLEC